jgi:FkbM family methyltransferase
MIRKIAFALPPVLIRTLGRLQFTVPLFAPLINYGARKFTETGEGIIKYGIGAGLKFDATGGAPGYLLGTTEPEEQEALKRHLKEGGTFYDIGANIGFYSTLAARLVGPKGHVYAFEPFPKSAQIARKNIAINGFTNATVVEAAVSSKPGTVWLSTEAALSSKAASSGQFKVLQEFTPEGIEVQAITIDEFIEVHQAKPPSLVMLDVEGAEIDVLHGMMQTIRHHRPIIMCEVHWLGVKFLDFYTEHLSPLHYSITTLQDEPVPSGLERYHALMLPQPL